MKRLDSTVFQMLHQKLVTSLGTAKELHLSSPLAYTDSALEVLLATIITQATSDRNALKAWLRFKETYTSPGQALEKDESLLLEVLRPAGLEHQKSRKFREVLAAVRERLGEYSLDKISGNPEEAWDFLCSLPGVGPKTAACTMLFGLGHPAFPVDTHIQRIAVRMGWAPATSKVEAIQTLLQQSIPQQLHQDLHILLLNLGRSYCRPRQRKCDVCPVGTHCRKDY
ncbi:MAG TPA: endonuclease III [Bacillota bacterium]|nr:endonuclease III [Bacillota bacterium]